MQEVLEKILNILKEKTIHQLGISESQFSMDKGEYSSYCSLSLYDVQETIKQAAAEYEQCYKDCTECDAYNKEKHHCPKFCHVITEAVKEIEENHNDWIACTDRLPTAEEYQRGNGRFLVTDGNRVYEAEFDIYESHTFGKSRMAADWFVTDKCVTHWQNEPLPPKS